MKRLSFIFIAFMLLFPAAVQAKDTGAGDQWDQLEDTSGQALELVKQEKYDDAKKMLEYFEDKFIDEKQDTLGLSMKQLRILSTSYDHALREVNSVSDGQGTRVSALMQFHLVVDALHSDSQPLWLSTKKQLFNSFDQMKQAVTKKDNRAFQFYLNHFLNNYEMIHPALNVDLKEAAMGRLESEVQFLMKHRSHFFDDTQYTKHLDRMDKDFHALYDGTLEKSMDPTLPRVIISIGGIIVIVLFYTGVRKYRGERKKQKEKAKKHSQS